jgi:hypothetical protein
MMFQTKMACEMASRNAPTVSSMFIVSKPSPAG